MKKIFFVLLLSGFGFQANAQYKSNNTEDPVLIDLRIQQSMRTQHIKTLKVVKIVAPLIMLGVGTYQLEHIDSDTPWLQTGLPLYGASIFTFGVLQALEVKEKKKLETVNTQIWLYKSKFK